MLVGIILATTRIEETLILGRSLVIPLIIMEIPTIILMVILIRCPDFENSVKEFMISQKNFNALLEEKLLKVDDLARNVDRLFLDVDSLKLDLLLLSMISMSLSKL